MAAPYLLRVYGSAKEVQWVRASRRASAPRLPHLQYPPPQLSRGYDIVVGKYTPQSPPQLDQEEL